MWPAATAKRACGVSPQLLRQDAAATNMRTPCSRLLCDTSYYVIAGGKRYWPAARTVPNRQDFPT